ncbi:MAG: TSUP family transporter, partial [Gammaproteobacteria bacterium]|nr:TSUP family transporter [Gammaproteobacteria bacterium]
MGNLLDAAILLPLLAVIVGACVQTGVGIGFSIVAAPLMLGLYGPSNAIPLLLLFNVVVSAVACVRVNFRDELSNLYKAIPLCVIGIVLGTISFPFLTESAVILLTASVMLLSLILSFVYISKRSLSIFLLVCCIAGVATAWTATPGPLLALGLLLAGYDSVRIRRLIQPIALIAYGIALVAHLINGSVFTIENTELLSLLSATV